MMIFLKLMKFSTNATERNSRGSLTIPSKLKNKIEEVGKLEVNCPQEKTSIKTFTFLIPSLKILMG